MQTISQTLESAFFPDSTEDDHTDRLPRTAYSKISSATLKGDPIATLHRYGFSRYWDDSSVGSFLRTFRGYLSDSTTYPRGGEPGGSLPYQRFIERQSNSEAHEAKRAQTESSSETDRRFSLPDGFFN